MERFKIIWVCICVATLLGGCGKILAEEETCESLGNCDDLSSMALSYGTFVSEMVLSSDIKAISSQGVSSESLSSEISSSSMEVSSSSKFVAVSSVMSSFNEVWDGGSYRSIDIVDMDEWGLIGDDKGAFVFPWSDVESGGNSAVLDELGSHLGVCQADDPSFSESWKIESAVVRSIAGSD